MWLAYRLFVLYVGYFNIGGIFLVEKQRIIQEYVPGRQITLAHIISNPERDLCNKLGIFSAEERNNAVAILTITPSEAVIIAADVATKSANVEILFIDRFSGSLMISGDTASCEVAVKEIISFICTKMGFATPEITRS